MKKYTVAVIVGSLRKESINLKLARALTLLGKDKFNANFVRIDDLPLYNQDLEANFPANVSRMKQEIEQADAILIVSPEYNRSIPGALKNAFDWSSRPWQKNSFAGKTVAIIGASSAIGTACAQQHLRPILGYLDARVMGQPEAYINFKKDMIDEHGVINDESSKKFLQAYVDAFVAWIAKNI